MAVVSRSVPGLFGGVSQKVPALRHPTQGSVQDNGLSTVVDGLYKRPGTEHVATLPVTHTGGLTVANSGGNLFTHVIDRGDGKRHLLVIGNGSMMLYDLETGQPQTVNNPDGFTYLLAADPKGSFRCLTVADYTFVVNTTRVPSLTTAQAPARPNNIHYVNIRTAVHRTTYRVMLADSLQYQYTSLDTTNSQTIALGLAGAINQSGQFTAYVVPGTNVIRIDRPTAFTCSVSDDWGNAGIQCISNGVDKYSDLPSRFQPGYTVSIKGLDGGKDEYHVRWNGTAWEETPAPGMLTTLEPAHMPHRLKPNLDGSWTFERCTEWEPRKVGDNRTNPIPSFVGRNIRGVFFHRNRLGFLAGDAVVLSRPGDYYAFWSTTAQQSLATDPIDLSASHEGVEFLEWATGYNKNLLLWSSAAQQFTLVGGDVLTADSARIVPSSSFEVDPKVRPVSMGNRALFAASRGAFSVVSMYRVSQDRQTDTADELTENVPEYIPAGLRMLAASTTFKAAVAVPSGDTREVFMLKYEQDKKTEELTQLAWQRFTLDRAEKLRVLHAHWVKGSLFLALYTQAASDNSAAGHLVLERINFDTTADRFNMGFGLRLDRQVAATFAGFDGTYSSFDVPYIVGTGVVLLRQRPGMEPEEFPVVSLTPQGPTGTRLRVVGSTPVGTYVAGGRFGFTYEFTEAFMQDREGTPLMASELKHVRTLVRYVDTGHFTAEVGVHLRGAYSYAFNGRTVGQPGQGPSQLALSTGTFAIPVHSRANHVRVRLKSDSYFPCLFPYAEVVGDATVKASR